MSSWLVLVFFPLADDGQRVQKMDEMVWEETCRIHSECHSAADWDPHPCAEFVRSPPASPQAAAAEAQLPLVLVLILGMVFPIYPLRPSLCGVWCYWEHFQVFPETLERFILLKCCSDWGCHGSSVCVKSPFPFPSLSPWIGVFARYGSSFLGF